MSEQATQKVNNPAVHKILDDGTVLYKTWDQAEAARLQQASQQQSGITVKKLSQVKSGEQYLGRDGKAVPYTLGSLVEFQVTGLIVVIVVLAGLSLICAAVGRLLKSSAGTAAAPAAAVPAAVLPPVPTVSGVGIHPGLTDQQLVALLTAAATSILEKPVRIEHFRPLTAKDLNWAVQGRSDLQSHRLK